MEDGLFVRWAPEDPELKTLRDDDPQQWASMMAQYGPGDGLAAFDAIGASGAAELRAAGIESVTALAKATSTRADCRRLAAQLGVGPILVERWANLAAIADALHAPRTTSTF